MSERERFMQRVRRAVAAGNRAGAVPSRPQRDGVGHQGAGPDPVARFTAELTAAGGVCHVVADDPAAVAVVTGLVRERRAERVLLGGGPVVERLALAEPLLSLGATVWSATEAETGREAFFAADVGVGGVDYLVAETGTVVLRTRPEQPRSLSLLPPVHIAVADRGQLLPDLFDLFEVVGPADLPACLSLITGPSKTGDIELRLVTGVHGPGEIHVVLIDRVRAGP
jgi:L-lactate utilization protein LutC